MSRALSYDPEVKRDPFDLVGTTIAEKYRVDRVLGEGGFGLVYQGRHLIVGEPVAIKCMKVAGESGIEARYAADAFLREARALFSLTHPAIVRLYDVGVLPMTSEPMPYVVLELLEGVALEDDIDRRALTGEHFTASELLFIFEPVLEALAFAHDRGVVHRDLKPANVMLLRGAAHPRDGLASSPAAKVLDFGTARLGPATLTKGPTGFTPRYAAPEQWDASLGPSGAPSDTFALGLMIAEACILHPVIGGAGISEIFAATMAGPVPRIRDVRPDLPVQLEDVLVRATRKAPAERYPNARELLDAFRAAFGVTIADRAGNRPIIAVPPSLALAATAPRAALDAPPVPVALPVPVPIALAPTPTPAAAPPAPPALVRPRSAPAPAPSITPLVVGLLALVVAMIALAATAGLLLRPQHRQAPAPAPSVEAAPP